MVQIKDIQHQIAKLNKQVQQMIKLKDAESDQRSNVGPEWFNIFINK
jgi:hypothetical protein